MAPTPRQCWLCLPPLAACILDVSFTLAGQRPEYWAGNYSAFDEANPVAAWFMQLHPLAFLGLIVVWAILFCLIIACWENSGTVVIAFVLTLSHSVGAGTWLTLLGWPGYLLAVVLLLGLERLLSWSWKKAGIGTKDRQPASEPRT
jgi:hypothetical protein